MLYALSYSPAAPVELPVAADDLSCSEIYGRLVLAQALASAYHNAPVQK